VHLELDLYATIFQTKKVNIILVDLRSTHKQQTGKICIQGLKARARKNLGF